MDTTKANGATLKRLPVVFRHLCHLSIIQRIGMMHDSTFRLR